MKDMATKALNLQFFAEPTPAPTPEPEPTPTPEPTPAPEVTTDEQLQQMRVEMAKMKKAMDKATGEASEYKKQLRAKQSADEIALQEKAEKEAAREEEFNSMKKELTLNRYEKNYLALGYPEDLAGKAADAQFENDTDALFKIQSDFQAMLLKNKEAEWLKNRPVPRSGNGDGEETEVTKEQFDRMGYKQRVDFQRKYPKAYKSFTE